MDRGVRWRNEGNIPRRRCVEAGGAGGDGSKIMNRLVLALDVSFLLVLHLRKRFCNQLSVCRDRVALNAVSFLLFIHLYKISCHRRFYFRVVREIRIRSEKSESEWRRLTLRILERYRAAARICSKRRAVVRVPIEHGLLKVILSFPVSLRREIVSVVPTTDSRDIQLVFSF